MESCEGKNGDIDNGDIAAIASFAITVSVFLCQSPQVSFTRRKKEELEFKFPPGSAKTPLAFKRGKREEEGELEIAAAPSSR